MLKTLDIGTQVGIVKMSVSGPKATVVERRAVRVALLWRATHRRERLGTDRHVPAVGGDREEVRRPTGQDHRETRDGQVGGHGDQDRHVRQDVDDRRRVAQRVAERRGEQGELDDHAEHDQRRPAELQVPESSRRAARQETEDETGEDGVEDEHEPMVDDQPSAPEGPIGPIPASTTVFVPAQGSPAYNGARGTTFPGGEPSSATTHPPSSRRQS